MFEVTAGDIALLNSEQLPILLNRLLYLQISEYPTIIQYRIFVSQKKRTSDGGEDGRIEWKDGPESTNFLPQRLTLFQCKATAQSKAMTPAKCADEFVSLEEKKAQGKKTAKKRKAPDALPPSRKIKPTVEEAFKKGGGYVLFCTESFTPPMLSERIEKMREAIAQCGRVDAKEVGIEIYDASRIADWVNYYISAISYVLECLGKPLLSGIKTATELKRSRVWVKKEHLYNPDEFKQNVHLVAQSIKNSGVACIVGESGVGKTQLALTYIRPDLAMNDSDRNQKETLFHQTIYIDLQYQQNLEIVDRLQEWIRDKRKGIIILNHVHPSLISELIFVGGNCGGRLKLLIITNDPYLPSHHKEVIGPVIYSKDFSVGILDKQYRRRISSVELESIAEFSGGNPKLALEVAFHYAENRGHLSLDKTIEKFFFNEKILGKDVFNVLQWCALFTYVGFKGKAFEHCRFIASIGNVKDADQVYQLMKKSGRLQERGRFAVFSPPALRIKLAEKFWHECSEEKAKLIVDRVKDSPWVLPFAHSLSQLSESPTAKAVAQYFCCFFKFDAHLSMDHQRILLMMVELAPNTIFAMLDEYFHQFIPDPDQSGLINVEDQHVDFYIELFRKLLLQAPELFTDIMDLLFWLKDHVDSKTNFLFRLSDIYSGVFMVRSMDVIVPLKERLIILQKHVQIEPRILDLIYSRMYHEEDPRTFTMFIMGPEKRGFYQRVKPLSIGKEEATAYTSQVKEMFDKHFELRSPSQPTAVESKAPAETKRLVAEEESKPTLSIEEAKAYFKEQKEDLGKFTFDLEKFIVASQVLLSDPGRVSSYFKLIEEIIQHIVISDGFSENDVHLPELHLLFSQCSQIRALNIFKEIKSDKSVDKAMKLLFGCPEQVKRKNNFDQYGKPLLTWCRSSEEYPLAMVNYMPSFVAFQPDVENQKKFGGWAKRESDLRGLEVKRDAEFHQAIKQFYGKEKYDRLLFVEKKPLQELVEEANADCQNKYREWMAVIDQMREIPRIIPPLGWVWNTYMLQFIESFGHRPEVLQALNRIFKVGLENILAPMYSPSREMPRQSLYLSNFSIVDSGGNRYFSEYQKLFQQLFKQTKHASVKRWAKQQVDYYTFVKTETTALAEELSIGIYHYLDDLGTLPPYPAASSISFLSTGFGFRFSSLPALISGSASPTDSKAIPASTDSVPRTSGSALTSSGHAVLSPRKSPAPQQLSFDDRLSRLEDARGC